MKVEFGKALWSHGSRWDLDAHMVHGVFEKIRKSHDGHLKPEDIVSEATSKRSKLHKAFNWDDADAANEFRKDQARSMIRSLVVYRREAPKEPMRLYEVTREPTKDDPVRQVYATIEDICADPEKRAELFQTVLNDLVRCRRKYAQLREFASVFRAIDELLEAQPV